jgi:hypothetical protein
MKKLNLSLPVVVLIAVVALVVGSFGTATAAGLTAGKVKKIAVKVVKKQAPSLSVAHATTAATAANATSLGGQAPSAYLDNSTVYNVTVAAAATSRNITIPLSPGTYQIGYSAYLTGGSGFTFCQIARVRGPVTFYTADDAANTTAPSMSAVGVVDVQAGDVVRLFCSSGTAWTTLNLATLQEPIQIIVTPLDSVTTGTLAAARATDGGRAN